MRHFDTLARHSFLAASLRLLLVACVAAGVLSVDTSAQAARRQPAPSHLRTVSVTTTTATVRWVAPASSRAFRVKYSTSPSMRPARYRRVTARVVTLKGLTVNRRYYVRVRAVAPRTGRGLSAYTPERHVVATRSMASRGTSHASMVLRRTKPTSSNVGAGVIRSAPTKLATSADGTWSNGVLTIKRDLRNRVVNGFVRVGRSGLTIENCDIRGDQRYRPNGTKFMVDTGGGFTGTVVRYNDIHNTFQNSHINAIGPRNVTAEYNDISHVTDGFVPSPRAGVMNVNMVIRGNYVHDFAFYGNDPGHDPTPLMTAGGVRITGRWAGRAWNHADAVQVQVDGTTGMKIYGNNFVATWAKDKVSTLPLPNAIKELSDFMLNGGRNLVIEDNWLDGGEYAVNNADPAVTGSFARNHFGRRMAHRGAGDGGYFALMIASSHLVTHDGTADQNTWQDSGKVVHRRKN